MVNNILIIGDLHAPFIQEGYLEHCKETYKKYHCNKVIFIGDLIDNHYSSFYDTDPDGLSAGQELEQSIEQLKPWYKAFPIADVCIGNHDRRVMTATFKVGLSKRWIRDFKEVLQTPTWRFADTFTYDNVLYTHGEAGNNLLTLLLNTRLNLVIGHWHAKVEIIYNASKKDLLWAMSVGCGIDIKQYAFAYADHYIKRFILACGVVLDNGQLPIIIPFKY
jgi:hypothetical protein